MTTSDRSRDSSRDSRSTCYFGNIPYATTKEEIVEFLHPRVPKSVTMIIDRQLKRGKGFAFVEFASTEEADACVLHLDGTDFKGRTLKVSIAQPRGE